MHLVQNTHGIGLSAFQLLVFQTLVYDMQIAVAQFAGGFQKRIRFLIILRACLFVFNALQIDIHIEQSTFRPGGQHQDAATDVGDGVNISVFRKGLDQTSASTQSSAMRNGTLMHG